jgi:tryptophanyl-tRNA synthetase
MGELSRMTQFKDKSAKLTLSNKTTTIPASLFMYPVLMAADILLYDPNYVLVGADQKQHLELTRDIALRMNNKYGNLFQVPEPMIPKSGAKIMDLINPTIKMSKSNTNENGTIFLLDSPTEAESKIMSAKTDSLNKISYDEKNQPGISNLLTIYSCLSNQKIDNIVKQYENKNYGAFKKDLAKVVGDFLKDFQARYQQIIGDPGKLISILNKNADICTKIANTKLMNVYKAIGLIK